MKPLSSYLYGLICFSAVIIVSCSNDPIGNDNGNGKPMSGEHTTPGIVIAFSPAETGVYLGSPSIVILDDGTYIASHDKQTVTCIYQSDDKGINWGKVAEIPNMQWASLFVHKGEIYLLGVNHSFGAVHIRKSSDGGINWTTPTGSSSGILFTDGQFHTAPVPVVIYNGRIWRSFEDAVGNTADRNFRTLVISADVNADLLNASSWQASNRLSYNTSWGGKEWIEGNIVLTPDNKLVNILRNDSETGERVAMVHVENSSLISFDPTSDFITFPGGSTKFTIRYDATTKRYWSLTNYIPDQYKGVSGDPASIRNTLSLISSEDLKTWEVHKTILQNPDYRYVGYQYVDWQMEGSDMVAVIRTAHSEPDGTNANNFHDSNYILFYRVMDFRASIPTPIDTIPEPEPFVADDMAITVMGESSATFKLLDFANGVQFYTNRDYVLQRVPEAFKGFSFLASDGNVIDRGIITPSRNGYIYLISQKRGDGKPGNGWTLISDFEFSYNDYNVTKLYIYQKQVTAGQIIEIPELDGFPGSSPLAKSITYVK